MSKKTLLHFLAILMISVPVLSVNARHVYGQNAQATQSRPIGDLLATQGVFEPDGTVFVPPIRNFIGWFDPNSGLFASVDYAGLADLWITTETDGEVSFNTQFAGTIKETPLNDGRTKVHAVLRTTNALTWVFDSVDFTGDFGTTPLIFGARAPDVLLGAEPALGDSLLQVVFIHDEPVGGELPDLLQLLLATEPGQEVLRFSFHSTTFGEAADGTAAKATVQQQGIFHGYGKNHPAGFPVETVRVEPIGN